MAHKKYKRSVCRSANRSFWFPKQVIGLLPFSIHTSHIHPLNTSQLIGSLPVINMEPTSCFVISATHYVWKTEKWCLQLFFCLDRSITSHSLMALFTRLFLYRLCSLTLSLQLLWSFLFISHWHSLPRVPLSICCVHFFVSESFFPPFLNFFFFKTIFKIVFSLDNYNLFSFLVLLFIGIRVYCLISNLC